MSLSFLDQLALSAEKFPHQVIIDSMGLPITTSQLWAQSDHVAAALHATGFAVGDTAAISLPDCAQLYLSYLGIVKAGGKVLMCSPVATASEIYAEMAGVSAETLFIMSNRYLPASSHPRKPDRLVVAEVKQYLPRWKKLKFKYVFEKKNGHRVELAADAFSFNDLLKLGKKSPEIFVEAAPGSAEADLGDFVQHFMRGQLYSLEIDPLFL